MVACSSSDHKYIPEPLFSHILEDTSGTSQLITADNDRRPPRDSLLHDSSAATSLVISWQSPTLIQHQQREKPISAILPDKVARRLTHDKELCQRGTLGSFSFTRQFVCLA